MKKYLLYIAICLALTGCKRQDWLDWKAMNEAWIASHDTYTYINGQDTVVFPMKTTASGLKYCILSQPNPTEARPSISSSVMVEYTGELINGYRFTDTDGVAQSMAVASLVQGWQEGIQKVHCHGDIVMYIPADLGYGSEAQNSDGSPSYIPPYSVLIFKVHLYAIQ